MQLNLQIPEIFCEAIMVMIQFLGLINREKFSIAKGDVSPKFIQVIGREAVDLTTKIFCQPH